MAILTFYPARTLKQLPPRLVPLAEALCVLLSIQPDSRSSADCSGASSESDFWRPLRRRLCDASFIKDLASFDRMSVTLHTIKRLQVIVALFLCTGFIWLFEHDPTPFTHVFTSGSPKIPSLLPRCWQRCVQPLSLF